MSRNIFAPSKVDLHKERIDAYWRNEQIWPVTMELDLTQKCTRICEDCPFSISRHQGHTLDLPFLDRLFGIVGPHTPGLIVSGGEPTSVAHFPQTLALARAKGFQEISVISNGACLGEARVQDALLAHATAVRVSLYDWQDGPTPSFTSTLDKIRFLRKRIDSEESTLQIGASILTRTEWVPRLENVAMSAIEAGVDWVYFHPFCINWQSQKPIIAEQHGVLNCLEQLRKSIHGNDVIQIPHARYEESVLHFSQLHGAHFLLQVGADGVVYAGPECKYDKDYALLDLNVDFTESFLQNPKRHIKIASINSDNYLYIGTKHRPSMFSDHIERSHNGIPTKKRIGEEDGFLHPKLI